jgi:hypothetical protein
VSLSTLDDSAGKKTNHLEYLVSTGIAKKRTASLPNTKIIALPIVIACAALLLFLVDDGFEIGHWHNTLRNWKEFGIFELHGQLVTNPGGFEATTQPEIHKGMSPISLYPAYAVTKLLGWTGLGTLSFHILLALFVIWATWKLLRQDNFAFVVAAVTVLSPAYFYWQKMILDPNIMPLLLSLPYITVIVAILKTPKLSYTRLAGLFALTLCFTSINWTTAWVYGPCALLLWFLPDIGRRKTILFVALAGISCGLLVVGSVASRASANGVGFVQFIQSYTWENVGYGLNLTSGKALLRLTFVNGVALLPLLPLFGWTIWRQFRGWRHSCCCISPVALALIEVVIMRNYFAHHPWLPSPLLLVSVILSLVLFHTDHVIGAGAAIPPATTRWQTPIAATTIILCAFVYGLGVLFFVRGNQTDILSLVSLIRHATQRSALVVVVQNVDPLTAQVAARFPDFLDRHVMVVRDLKDVPQADHVVILSAVPINVGLKLIAQSNNSESKWSSWQAKGISWFNNYIARRQSGDRLDVAVKYFLYDAAPPGGRTTSIDFVIVFSAVPIS